MSQNPDGNISDVTHSGMRWKIQTQQEVQRNSEQLDTINQDNNNLSFQSLCIYESFLTTVKTPSRVSFVLVY